MRHFKFSYSEEFLSLFEKGLVSKPERKTKLAAGYDLFIPIEEDVVIEPHTSHVFNLGISLEAVDASVKEVDVEDNFRAEVYVRSSTPKKRKLIPAAKCYAFLEGEELSIKLYNYSDDPVVVTPNDRICQLVVCSTKEDFSEKGTTQTVYQYVNTQNTVNVVPGYSFTYILPEDVTIKPGQVFYAMTGIKGNCPDNTFIILHLNSAVSELTGIVMANGYGIIDADYYQNGDNDGNIGFPLLNLLYEDITIKKGTVIGYSSVREYFISEDSKECISCCSDCSCVRTGGMGSTDK